MVVLLLLQITIGAQTVKNFTKNDEISPELKEKAIAILSRSARESEQLFAPENRVRAQIIIADLLWEQNEKDSRTIFETAFRELQSMFAVINPSGGEEKMSRNERAKHYAKRQELANLRRELVLSLAAHDPKIALSAFNGLKIQSIGEYDPLIANDLELQLTSAIAQKDPEKSLQIAKKQLDANGLNY